MKKILVKLFINIAHNFTIFDKENSETKEEDIKDHEHLQD